MVEGGGWPAFPVLFFDGEREMNIGDVKISPTLEYKPFQQTLSQRIGISPNQISIYLLDRRKNPNSPFSKDRRRTPITGKVNFGLICRQKDCCFLVVLKRSRKSRSRKERAVHDLEFANFLQKYEFPPPAIHSVPENLILVRRNDQVPFQDQITQSELSDLNGRLQSLEFQRENYQMAMTRGELNLLNIIPNMHTDLIPNFGDRRMNLSATRIITKTDNKKAPCKVCVNAEKHGSTTSFHHCVNDAVVTRFTTLFGPIRRPNKPFP